jgi:uncharacterized protein YndB with AHSA1/START domain
MARIRHYLLIKSSPEKVYTALTTTEGLKGWWTSEAKAAEFIGGIAEFIFGDRYHNKMRVTYLEPNKKIEWECLKGDKEWVGTTLIFDIEKKGDNTTLRFTHGNWKEETDFFASCNYHWGYYMRSLAKYCETGEGTPFTN